MKLSDLDKIIVDAVTRADHPEIVSATALNYGTDDKFSNHCRVAVKFASGGTATVMVRKVSGPGISSHEPYKMPREVL